MKKSGIVISPTTVMIVMLLSVITVSCDKENVSSGMGKRFYDVVSKGSFSLENQAELNQLAKVLANEPGEITILKDASVVDLSDKNGPFKAISVQYKVGEVVTKMIVPINEVHEKDIAKGGKGTEGVIYYTRVDGCEMKCTTTNNCTSCTQEIIEKCVSQTCTCNGGIGGCEASTTFPPS